MDSLRSRVAPSLLNVKEGFYANLDALRGLHLEDYRIIHFAAHAFTDQSRTNASGVLLSRFDECLNPIDGLLTTQDVYRLKLNASLVVLSACASIQGRILPGEGLMGLEYAFLHAGAHLVIGSLWSVNDAAAAQLMDTFYNAFLTEGRSASASLRLAQLDLQDNYPRWRHPYYWAAFSPYGPRLTSRLVSGSK